MDSDHERGSDPELVEPEPYSARAADPGPAAGELEPSSLPPPHDVLLSAEGLSARLQGAEILRRVHLRLSARRVVGLLGPSGAGKSTLFRCLIGEIAPSEGRVWLSGEEVTKLPVWRRARLGLGYMPQTPSVLLDLSVAANLRSFERIARVRAVPVEERAESVGLERRLHVKARDLSGGERRRLELLRALMGEPRVLICDEPLTGVDPTAAERIFGLLRAVADRGGAVLIADHRVRETLQICDEALFISDGRLELKARPDEFARHPAVRERYLG